MRFDTNGLDVIKKNASRMEWEKPYLEALIDHLQPAGRVLEVGFALGYSSAHIQTFHPKEHIIIESDPAVAMQAKEWASNKANVSVLEDTWEHALPKLGAFDAIFFNDFRPEMAQAKEKNRAIGNQAIQKGKKIVADIQQEMPDLTSMRYSDSDINQLCESADQSKLPLLAKFIWELAQNGQITKQQYETAAAKHKLQLSAAYPVSTTEKQRDPTLHFLKTCLSDHLLPGGRFSCFSHDRTSNFDNSAFFESIITNPNIEYQEKLISIEVPKSCKYFKYDQALIMLVEKTS